MAELLICSRNGGGIGVGQYKRGDIVTVQEDGFDWGSTDQTKLYVNGGMFVRLKIPGVAVSKVKAYVRPEWILQNSDNGMTQRRLWGFLIDSIPAGVRTTLLNTGEYTTTVAAIKAFVRNKVTDEEADFNG